MKHFLAVVNVLFFFSISSELLGQQKVDMYIAGDLMAHQSQLTSALVDSTHYDFSQVWKYLKDDISSADVAIANLETTLSRKGEYSGYPRFKSPVSYAQAAKDAGFDVFLLANNHIYDHYRTGLRKMIKILDSLKVPHTGAWKDTVSHNENRVLLVEKNGIRFAVLNYTYATNIASAEPVYVNYIDTTKIKEDIAVAKLATPDVIIACMHWGVEYEMLPTSLNRKRADFLVRNGVSVVIGSHPHVVQPMEKIKDENGQTKAVVFYSLGNYISGQRTIDTQGGAVAHLSFSKNKDNTVSITDAKYSLVWVWKPKDEHGKEHFLLVPLNEAQKGTYPLTKTEKAKMDAFATNARNIFSENNIEITEKKD